MRSARRSDQAIDYKRHRALLRTLHRERGKIRARRVTGNCDIALSCEERPRGGAVVTFGAVAPNVQRRVKYHEAILTAEMSITSVHRRHCRGNKDGMAVIFCSRAAWRSSPRAGAQKQAGEIRRPAKPKAYATEHANEIAAIEALRPDSAAGEDFSWFWEETRPG